MINRNRAFSFKYETKEGIKNTYVCRFGVMRWKGMDGSTHEVQGYDMPTPKGAVRLFCFSRKGYRMFYLNKMEDIKQGKKIYKKLTTTKQ